ncbi:MAG: CocE/NonD family hydrolase [Scytonematopsis contorta HA4267-MV1]|jgi:hypothetical protein|nr:CocE/NonD family hydrolase [Scytonematopsis contorta HA4267-MV1]
MLKVKPKETTSMYTRDGIRLDADIYRPDSSSNFPILLMRQPYGREIASTIVYAHPIWYASQGYIVAIQDVRGRGTSQGEFKLFAHEIEDGEDTVNWAVNLPGSSGNVGMYGFSYQGMTQIYAALSKPPALKTICPAMIGYDLYEDWAYEGGAFCFQTNLAWAIQLATETARLRGDEKVYQALFAASRNLPICNSEIHNPEILKNLAPDSFYHQWLSNSQSNDEYWQNLLFNSSKTNFQNIDLPIFHIGGWFDTYLRGTLKLYKNIAARSQYRQQLLVGPWAHIPWGRKVGDIDFGQEAISPVDKMQIHWFDHFLKNIDTGLLNQPSISLFEMGVNIWQTLSNIPEKNYQCLYLSSTGLSSIQENDGKLKTENSQSSTDILVHDPWRPVPSLGGHAGIPAGVFERSHIDCRSDVLTYTSDPLESDIHLLGNVEVEINCIADKPSFDLCTVLSEVYLDGRIYNLTQGYIHCSSTKADVLIKIKLQFTCAKIIKGHSLRLSISAACFPAYAMNTGTKLPSGQGKWIDAQITTLTVNNGGNKPSRIFLPVHIF